MDAVSMCSTGLGPCRRKPCGRVRPPASVGAVTRRPVRRPQVWRARPGRGPPDSRPRLIRRPGPGCVGRRPRRRPPPRPAPGVRRPRRHCRLDKQNAIPIRNRIRQSVEARSDAGALALPCRTGARRPADCRASSGHTVDTNVAAAALLSGSLRSRCHRQDPRFLGSRPRKPAGWEHRYTRALKPRDGLLIRASRE
jgi:hypothetical protein